MSDRLCTKDDLDKHSKGVQQLSQPCVDCFSACEDKPEKEKCQDKCFPFALENEVMKLATSYGLI